MCLKAELKTNCERKVFVKTIGFIVNPVAGMGGSVGLKGTDGKEILKKAILLGAKPMAPIRAESFLSELKLFEDNIRLVVGAGIMGENEARNCGFICTAIGDKKEKTTADDTKKIAGRITKLGVDILIFCGGDGTARDIQETVGIDLPVLGVPTGVKMHSAIFAVEPKAAARIVIGFLWGELPLREAEVMGVDEISFRRGEIAPTLYGYLLTPYEPYLTQGLKIASPTTESETRNQAAIAIYIIENMKNNVVYIIGPGTTTRTIADLLDENKTLLGVDLFCNKKLIAKDVNEIQILEKIKEQKGKIIVTPIGGQGFIFGRGNQQISNKVIRQVGWYNIIVVATERKYRSLKCLRVDTGNPSFDDKIRGKPLKVITDYKIERLIHIE